MDEARKEKFRQLLVDQEYMERAAKGIGDKLADAFVKEFKGETLVGNILELHRVVNIAKDGAIKLRPADSLKNHPRNNFADIPPGKRWNAFKESIRTIGIIHPIVIDVHKRILSGKQRWRACMELGIKCPTIMIREALSSNQARQIIVILNLGREYTRDELNQLWNEVYADLVKELLKAGTKQQDIVRTITRESGLKPGTVKNQVQKVITGEMRKRFKTIEDLDFLAFSAKTRLRSLADQAGEILDRITRQVEMYREVRSEIAKILRPALLNLPEIAVQYHPEDLSGVTGVPDIAITKSDKG